MISNHAPGRARWVTKVASFQCLTCRFIANVDPGAVFVQCTCGRVYDVPAAVELYSNELPEAPA